MTNSKRKRAWHVISQMNDEWKTVRELATLAGLNPKEMRNFLREAKKLGVLEYKIVKVKVNGKWSTSGAWRFRQIKTPKCLKCGHVLVQHDGLFICYVCDMAWKPVRAPLTSRGAPTGQTIKPQTR